MGSMRRVATIGVYGFSGSTFLAALRDADVVLLIDVRQRRGVRGSEYAWANSRRLQAALADGPLTAAELASRLNVDADALHRVMRVAAADGLFKLDRRGRFRLTRFGKTLRSDSPATLRPWARYMALDSTRRAWADLGESVRTGRSAFERVNGTSVWAWFAAHPEEEQLFAAAMRSITEFDGPALAASEL